MFEKEIDEIYELCKRVVNEVPTAFVVCEYSSRGLNVYGTKNEADIHTKSADEFHWDILATIYHDPVLEDCSRDAYERIKTYLLELLKERKCPNE